MEKKDENIQIRISKDQKKALMKIAKKNGLNLSEFILKTTLSHAFLSNKLNIIYDNLNNEKDVFYSFSELNNILSEIKKEDFDLLFKIKPHIKNLNYMAYIASMIELKSLKENFIIPDWIKEIGYLENPYFVTDLKKLRIYLLFNSKIIFKKRNIFADSSIGDKI